MTSRAYACLLPLLFAPLVAMNAHARMLFPEPVKWTHGDALGFAVADFDGDGFLDLVVPDRDFHEIHIHLGNGDGSFTTLPDQLSDDCPIDAAAGDFDGNGDLDLALAKYGGCTTGDPAGISVVLGNGDGTFAPETDYDSGQPLFSVVVGDFNGDDVLDLLGVGGGGLVLLGDGNGSFAMFEVDGQPYHAGVGDFDGDGLDDYAYPYGGSSGSVRVQFSNGDGTFSLAGTYPVGDTPGAVSVADVSQDSVLDLVVTNHETNDVSVLLGNGDGSFGPEQRYSLGLPPDAFPVLPWHVAIDDLDGDGPPDLVVATWHGGSPGNPSLTLFYGTGGGQFSAAVVGDSMMGATHEVRIEDFDGDGILDLARGCMNCSYVNWLFGDGRGAFATNLVEDVGDGPVSIAAGDFDGNGRFDLVTVNEDSDDVSVLIADGAGTFAPEQRSCVVDAVPPCPPGSDPAALVVAELTGDAHADLAVANAATHSVSILAGDGAGAFSFVTSVAVTVGTSPSAIDVADLDGDGALDLAVVGEGSSRLYLFLGNGDGTFDPPAGPLPSTGSNPTAVVLGRLDGDTFPDAAVANSGSDNVTVLLGNGDGTFTPAPTLPAGSEPADLAAADVDGDQHLDLVVLSGGSFSDNDLYVFLGNGDGTFAPPTILGPFDFTPIHHDGTVGIADLDGDGLPDLTTGGAYGSLQSVFQGNGDGTFEHPQQYASVGNGFALGDFDLDSRIDVAGSGVNGWIPILLNQSGPRWLRFEEDGVTLVWPAEIGALWYDVYRGDMPDLVDADDDGLPDGGYGSCMTDLDDDARDTFFEDPELPSPAGAGFFYLTSVATATGDGGAGSTSAGLPRVPDVPCP